MYQRSPAFPDGLLENGVSVNEELLDVYRKWDSENPLISETAGVRSHGHKPRCLWTRRWSHMSLKQPLPRSSIIGRTAGEEQDNSLHEGSYLLTAAERTCLQRVPPPFSENDRTAQCRQYH